MSTPKAFLSYAHKDDSFLGGAITALRDRLAAAYRFVSGHEIDIFLDKDGIAWGEQWRRVIDEALVQSTFLLPVVTPSFVESKECRRELEHLREEERKAGFDDLILPILLAKTWQLGHAERQSSDVVVMLLRERQWFDWTPHRHSDPNDRRMGEPLEELADKIWDAVRTRRPTSVSVPPTVAPTPGATNSQQSTGGERKPIVLRPLTEDEKMARLRALSTARKDEEKARRRADETPVPPLAAPSILNTRVGLNRPTAPKIEIQKTVESGVVKRSFSHGRSKAVTFEVKRTPATRPAPSSVLARVGPRPGRVFRDVDAAWCPVMVAIPSGQFTMGSSSEEAERSAAECPHHRVVIQRSFALGRYAVTFEEFDEFVREAAYPYPPDAPWGCGRMPVMNVSWEDSKAYCKWLSVKTRAEYRLPSEAEWEYACRAGTVTRYSWGDDFDEKLANVDGDKTVKVGSYPANPWELFDMHGNVWEWCEDTWHENYNSAPDDGSPWRGEESIRRVLRGGSWHDDQDNARSASRSGLTSGGRYHDIGFRVVCSFPI